MDIELSEQTEMGVYAHDAKGTLSLVHTYIDGDYGLEDVVTCFQLGKQETDDPAEPTVVELSFTELQKLKVLADANSFDYEAGFIEMCLDMHRFGVNQAQPQFRFLANF